MLKQPKRCLPNPEKIQIKYGFEGFGISNNFPYRNLLRFYMNFELKNWRSFYGSNSIRI
jgi:hypothetical protein